MNQRKSRQRGQAMTEYVVILALVGVAAILVFQSFGQVVRSHTAAMVHELGGESGATDVTTANNATKKASKQANDRNSLKSFATAVTE